MTSPAGNYIRNKSNTTMRATNYDESIGNSGIDVCLALYACGRASGRGLGVARQSAGRPGGRDLAQYLNI